MDLNAQFRYVCLDFETTGLDFKKDEPIQVGIVEMDADWKVVDTYLSYIKPEKPLKELKNIVQFITKIAVEDLEQAPSRDEVANQISHFFWKNTILIWHNIDFDFTFLKKLLPEVEIYDCFDTFQFSQALIPYAPSYALEILSQFLESKPLFLERKSHFLWSLPAWTSSHYHDALFDTLCTLTLFCYGCVYVQDLVKAYPILEKCFGKAHLLLATILNYSYLWPWVWVISLPALKKVSPANNLVIEPRKELESLKNGGKYYIGDVDFKELLLHLASKGNALLVFSTKQKLDIAKNLLAENGIKNIGFAKEEQTISSNLFSDFLNKNTFDQSEFYFLLKYCSHLSLGYGILDLNSKGDFMVYNFIKNSRWEVKYPLALTTQNGLYALLDKGNSIYPLYDIYFFDLEWWYRNYNQYLSRTCDLYYIQNFVDMLLYKYRLLVEFGKYSADDLSSLQAFDSFFSTFLGILWTDTKQLFIGHEEDTLISDPLSVRWEFYQTHLLLPKFSERKEVLQKILQKSDFLLLWQQLEHFFYLSNTIVKIQRKMYNQSDFYFLFSEETKFTNWEEFYELFRDKTVYFLSHSEKKYPSLMQSLNPWTFDYSFVTTFTALERKLTESLQEQSHSFFIVSTVKEESKALFEYLQTFPWLESFELLVENITWGAWKNLFKAKKKFAKILVGGYNFLMMCYAQGIVFDHVFIRNIKGPQSQLILDDIVRYAPKKA